MQQQLTEEKCIEELNKICHLVKLSKESLKYLMPGWTFDPIRILIFGRSKLGKTTLAMAIFATSFFNIVDNIFVVSPNYAQKTFDGLRCFVDDDNIYDQTESLNVYEEIFNKLTNIHKDNPDSKSLLIVDDVSTDTSTNTGRKGPFAKLVISAPHLNLSIIGIFHQVKTVTGTFRDNADIIIAFEPSSQAEFETLIRDLMPISFTKNYNKNLDILETSWKNGSFISIIRLIRKGTIVLKEFNDALI